MATLYVDHREIQLELDHGALALRRNGELEKRIPLAMLERVLISGDVAVSSRLVAALATAGIGVQFHAPRAKAWAVVAGLPGGDGWRRLGQARMALEPRWKELWAKRWVRAKAIAQAHLLRQEAERRAGARAVLLSSAARIDRAIERLRTETLTVDTVRGIEGAASAAYFEGFQRLFAPALEFRGRNRRPPRDPVNATLSLLYTIFYGTAVEAVIAAGLDPAIGYLHEPAPGRAALACDLVEPMRPAADRTAARLFHDGVLRPDHFRIEKGACLLGKAGRKAFYEGADEDVRRAGERMRRLARLVAKAADAVIGGREAPAEAAEDQEDAAALC